MLSPKGNAMGYGFRIVYFVVTLGIFGVCGWAQSNPAPAPSPSQETVHQRTESKGPAKEMAKGGEDIGIGVAKGTGELAKGTGSAVGNLARGKVGSAGASFGKGAAELGKNVTLGTAKGVFKVTKGIGGELRKL